MRQDPGHTGRPVELVDQPATHSTPHFPAGQGFAYSNTGDMIAGTLLEQLTGRPLHTVYRELVLKQLGMV